MFIVLSALQLPRAQGALLPRNRMALIKALFFYNSSALSPLCIEVLSYGFDAHLCISEDGMAL